MLLLLLLLLLLLHIANRFARASLPTPISSKPSSRAATICFCDLSFHTLLFARFCFCLAEVVILISDHVPHRKQNAALP